MTLVKHAYNEGVKAMPGLEWRVSVNLTPSKLIRLLLWDYVARYLCSVARIQVEQAQALYLQSLKGVKKNGNSQCV